MDQHMRADDVTRDENVDTVLLPSKRTDFQKLTELHRRSGKFPELAYEKSLNKDITCGFWIFKGPSLQKWANQHSYVIIHGLVGCFIAMNSTYFNGIISTLEKRFKIPLENMGYIAASKDISQILFALLLSYYAGNRHRPRWIGCGMFAIATYCLLYGMLHFFYGPGKDALQLTNEFIWSTNENFTITQNSSHLCNVNTRLAACDELPQSDLFVLIMLILPTILFALGSTLYFTLGSTYLDDNTKKSKAPALLSLSNFLELFGPALGYGLASFCLRIYIAPFMTPLITNNDSRWMGAWWMGWFLLAVLFLLFGVVYSMFPKVLSKSSEIPHEPDEQYPKDYPEQKASVGDMLTTFKRVITEKVYLYNILGRIFYFFGLVPYLMFTPKYIEIQYRQSASMSVLVTAFVPLAFSGAGMLSSGFILSKYKPSGRLLAAWLLSVDILTLVCLMCFMSIGCPDNETSISFNRENNEATLTSSCNSNCYCNFVPYSPICGENNMTYISPCHAGCTEEFIDGRGQKIFNNCSCISSLGSLGTTEGLLQNGRAISGNCPANCVGQFATFLVALCLLSFVGATARTPNTLIFLRSVSMQDKSAATGLGMVLMCLCTFAPAPIFFGRLWDRFCLVWGSTCSEKGNCWLYDSQSLRYALNIAAATFITIGALLHFCVWYYIKDLKIFDKKLGNETELEAMNNDNDESALKN